MKKKIIYIDEDARYGGPQHRMILVANHLSKKFDISFLISNDQNQIFKKKLIENKLNYEEIKITRLSKEFKTLIKYIIFFIPELIRLISILIKLKPDLVQVNSTPHFKALIASSLIRIPTIWVLEDANLPPIIKITFKILKNIFKPNILVTSSVVRNYYLNKYKFNKKLRKIYAPVSLKFFNVRRYKNKKFNKKKINILMIANLTKIKGIEVFLKIVKMSPNNLHFTLCGGFANTQKNYAKSLILEFKKFGKSKLNYIGYQKDIPRIISKSDIMICTSFSEAGPMTSLEGICMKKPLISNKVGIIFDLFHQKNQFCIVKNNEPDKFLSYIDFLSLNPSYRRKIINKSYNIVINELSVNQISKKYENYYYYTMKN